jgi:hypothetical protein
MKVPRKKRAPKIKGPSEHIIQSRLISQLDYALKPELEIRAIPNGGFRHRRVAMKLKDEGVKRGTPDLVVALPEGKVGWLEMKTDIGRLEQEQKDFRDKVILLGHLWGMARSVHEAMVILTAWGAIRKEFEETENDHNEDNPYLEYAEAA